MPQEALTSNQLSKIGEIESKGNTYAVYSGLTEELALAWAEQVGTDEEVKKWTSDPRKRSTSEDILKRNDPNDSEKKLQTYSVWDGNPAEGGRLVAISWYQVWKPGEAENADISKFLESEGLDSSLYVPTTSAFRIFGEYRGKGLGRPLVEYTEVNYLEHLNKNGFSDVIFTLETDQENKRAVGLYQKMGYEIIESYEQDRDEYRGNRILMVKLPE